MDLHSKWRKNAYLGVFLAAAMICSYIETLIPFNFGIPGTKLGLANIIVLMMLYLVGIREAFFVSMVRVVLTGLLFGNIFSLVYSFSGAILSFLVMVLLKKTGRLACVSISTAGGVCHNMGQLLAAAFMIHDLHIMFYVPILLFAGLATGLLMGILAQELVIRLDRFMRDHAWDSNKSLE